MSFIGAVEKGVTYTPGYFLAQGDEEAVRVTKQFAANSALAKTTADGAKYIPMGTAYPTNDANAIGITYEDVDVTKGDMPGSVVTKGIVYEDRLAITGYSAHIAPTESDTNPMEEGFYEVKSGGSASNPDDYVLTEDTEVVSGKTYYSSLPTPITISSSAKTALEALGFTFIASAPAVTRPY